MRLLPVLVLAILALTSCSGIATSISAPGPKALGAVHSIPVAELGDALGYWNVDWQGRAAQLYAEIAALNTRYCRTHAYVPGEADCNDMAADIWRELASEGIVSLIVVGNLEMARESFSECNHAWLIVYNGEGSAAALEVTTGRTYRWEDTLNNSRLTQYWEGFIYDKPSDVSEDFAERW